MPRNTIISYNPKLKQFARDLRNNSTLSEILLWRQIKGQKLGYEFHRQVPIDEFIVDFYCHELKLVIGVDVKKNMSGVLSALNTKTRVKTGEDLF